MNNGTMSTPEQENAQDSVPARSRRPFPAWVNAILFAITVATTVVAGAGHAGYPWDAAWTDYAAFSSGITYAFAVLLILTTHEFGHYFAARFHQLAVSLPFYIPVPIPGFHFGTMGAFIRIRSRIPNRQALMDVGAAGPVAGLIFSLIFLFYGYATLPDAETITAIIDQAHQRFAIPAELAESSTITITLGKSLLFMFFNDYLGNGLVPMSEVYHFPVLFAGWIGLFITALNLIPIGQLDGGHIVYALMPKHAGLINRLAYASLGLLIVVLYLQYGSVGLFWVPWMIILTLIGLNHPPTDDDSLMLTPFQRMIGWICVVTLILCFMPLPIYL